MKNRQNDKNNFCCNVFIIILTEDLEYEMRISKHIYNVYMRIHTRNYSPYLCFRRMQCSILVFINNKIMFAYIFPTAAAETIYSAKEKGANSTSRWISLSQTFSFLCFQDRIDELIFSFFLEIIREASSCKSAPFISPFCYAKHTIYFVFLVIIINNCSWKRTLHM